MTTQVFNDEMMNLIATDFQRRYEPNFAWGNVMSMYMQLPGLIGFWPGGKGINTSSGVLQDLSNSGLDMPPTGTPFETADSTGLRRWQNFDGTTDYFSFADSAYTSILGTETAMASSIRGLTVMAWVRPTNATPAASEGIAGKYNGGTNNKSWLLYRTTGLNAQLIITSDGSTNIVVTTTNDLVADEWRFIAARFTPSAQIRIWEGFTYGLVTNENTTSIPATLFDSNDNLAVGAFNTGTTPAGFWQGDLSLIALCRAALPDLFIESIFNLSRPLFIRR